MKRFVILIVAGLWALDGFSTAQFCELIYDGGEQKSMCSLILELDSVAFSKIEKRLPQRTMTTALYRNYIGCWKITNDSLFLDSVLVGNGPDHFKPIIIDDIFAEKRTASGYFADWVSDTLRVVSGGVLNYINTDWQSRWEKEEMVVIENGIVKSRKCVNNRLVNRGVGDKEFMSMLDSLELGEIAGRMYLEVTYSAFDPEGNPMGCKIRVLRSSGDAPTDDRVVTSVEKMMISNKPFPIYYIDNKFTSDAITFPIFSRPKESAEQ